MVPGMAAPKSFPQLMARFGKTANFARDMAVTDMVARAWLNREMIPAAHWGKILSLAEKRGFGDITPEHLIKLAAKRAAEKAVA